MTKQLLNKFINTTRPQSPVNRNIKENEERLIRLCSISIQDALAELKTNLQGLDTEEAENRLDECGPNELSHLKQLGFWADIYKRLKSPLVVQLLIIAAVSAIIGELKSTVIVTVMILLSVGDRKSVV